MSADEQRIEELRQIVAAVQERVRARHSRAEGGSAGILGVAPADLTPLMHARDAAQAKAAAIGKVNPRAGGPVNAAIQGIKKVIARSLAWFVREQVNYNREIVAAVEAILEALDQHNRVLAEIPDVVQFKDIRQHWTEWRNGQERREIEFLRSIAELQAGFQHRATQMEANFREIAATQHANFQGALERATLDIQKRLWADMEAMRWRYERMIHAELRLIRQRLGRAGSPTEPAAAETPPAWTTPDALDYARFAERFRGPEETVRKSLEFYRPRFEGREYVLDIGCGRGEFLELMRDTGVRAKGIDLSPESVAACREKGLDAEVADLFAFLAAAEQDAFDGIFSSQVVEHLDPMRLPVMISLCAAKLARGGLIAIETPDPQCLAIFASFFYLDPTHTRPVPRDLLEFYMLEAGLTEIETHPLSPAVELFPELADLPERIRTRFFGGLDYAILARKI